MTEHVHLVGAEDVRAAANTMRNAADEMQRAASNICGAMEHMGRLVERMETAMRDLAEALNGTGIGTPVGTTTHQKAPGCTGLET